MAHLHPVGNDATGAPPTSPPPPRRGIAFGCGGTLGFTWTVAALTVLQDVLGWDPRDADALVGTSAGAEMVALLASGVSVEDLAAVQLERPEARADLVRHHHRHPGMLPPLPLPVPGNPRLALRRDLPPLARLSGLAPAGAGDPAWLADLAATVAPGPGWLPHPAAWLVAMDYSTGGRVAFGSPGAPAATVSEALRASWAVPGWLPPVTVGGRRYVDGGAASTASADLLLPLGLDEVVVLAPMASRDLGPAGGLSRVERWALRNPMSAVLATEVQALRAAGTRVLLVDATDEDLEAMGPNVMNHRRRRTTFVRALRTTRATLAHELNEAAAPAHPSMAGVARTVLAGRAGA